MANHELLPVLAAASLTWGAVLALVRHLEPLLAERLANPTRVRFLFGTFLLGLVLGLPLGGLAVDEWGAGWGLALAPIGMSLAVGLLALEPGIAPAFSIRARPLGRFGTYIAALVGLGFSTAWLACATIVLMPAALWPEQPWAAVNIGFAFVGLGAVAAPLVADPFRQPDQAGRALLVLAVLCVVPGFVAVVTPTNWPPGHDADLNPIVSDPVVGLTAVALILYGMIAGGMERWVEERSKTPRAFRLYWWPFLGSRVVVGALLARTALAGGFEPWAAVLLGLGVTVALGQLAGLPETDRVPAFVGAIGFVLGPMVPTLAAALLIRFPQASGVALGVALAGGFLGQESLQPLARWLAARLPGRRRPGLPLPTSLVLLLVLLALALVQVKEEPRPPKPPFPFRLPEIHLPKMPHFRLFPSLEKKPSAPRQPPDSASETAQ